MSSRVKGIHDYGLVLFPFSFVSSFGKSGIGLELYNNNKLYPNFVALNTRQFTDKSSFSVLTLIAKAP